MDENPTMGQQAMCFCGHPIEYVGPYWRHVGKEFRHVAEPVAGPARQADFAPGPELFESYVDPRTSE